ncbi:hypothetical protein AVEN_22706-1 [Araneus ventricosus]|uniref:Uncharacterized protein n=1 Tax=Araneus ventricosus TaxID=182803 RepID=A0A4Y2SC71_ARAVE|nr:hypothetical protein AVEN_22706-1 [Araneus ventricosus]
MQNGALHTFPLALKICLEDILQKNVQSAAVFPARFLDLKHCDLRLWGYLKKLVDCDNSKTLPELEYSISSHVHNISRNLQRMYIEQEILRYQRVLGNNGR